MHEVAIVTTDTMDAVYKTKACALASRFVFSALNDILSPTATLHIRRILRDDKKDFRVLFPSYYHYTPKILTAALLL
jgi:hypothetical protein